MNLIKSEDFILNCIICDCKLYPNQSVYKISNYPKKRYACGSCYAEKNNTPSKLVYCLSYYNRCKIIQHDVFKKVYNNYIIGGCIKHNSNKLDFDHYKLEIDDLFKKMDSKNLIYQNGYFKILYVADYNSVDLLGYEEVTSPIILNKDLYDDTYFYMEEYFKYAK